MPARTTAVALPVLLVVALVAIVAIAATGSTPGGSSASRAPSETVYDMFFTLGLVAVALGLVVFAYGLMQRKAIQREVASGRYRRTTLLGWIVFVLLFTGVFYAGLIKFPKRVPEPAPEDRGGPASESPFPTLPEDAETSYTPTVSWIPIAVVVGLLLAGIAAYVFSERRARRGRAALADGSLALRLADVLDDTLDDLRAESDPRRAIIAAYARLELVLAANGIPRRAADTPQEYLERVLRSLGLAEGPIRGLTDLFTRAKFSQHEVDLAMKEEAIGALEHIRDELRRTRAEPVAGRDDVARPVGAES